jgi:hypothetical protein
MLTLFWDIWSSEAKLADLGPWFEVCFAVNLAYPILLNFGRFSGSKLCEWGDKEKLRVIFVLAENELFNEPEFSSRIDGIERLYLSIIWWINRLIVAWASFAFMVTFFLLLYTGFAREATIRPPQSVGWFIFICGAVPIGLFVIGLFYVFGHRQMKSLSKEHDGVIKFNKQAPTDVMQKAREQLQCRINEHRAAISSRG